MRSSRRRAAAIALLPAAGLFLSAPAAGQQKPAAPPKPNLSGLSKPAQAERLQNQAEELQFQGKWLEAAKLLQQAAEILADDWALWDKAGWGYLDATQPAQALPMFEKAAKTRPSGAAIPGGLLIAQFGMGNAKEVEALLKQMVDADTAAKGLALVKKGLAGKQFTPDWNFALGWLYAQVLRNSNRAVGPLEAVAKATPARADVWLLLVEVNRALDRGPNEDAAAIQYLTLAPDTEDAFRIKAERYAALQDYDSAVLEYEAGIKKYPLSETLHFQLARVHERRNQPKMAEAAYTKLVKAATAQKKESLVFQARIQLANFHARWRNYAEAEKFYREAAARPEAVSNTVDNWGYLLALTGKWEEAAKALDTSVQKLVKPAAGLAPTPDEILQARYRAALAHLAAGKRAETRALLDPIVADPKAERSGPLVEMAAFAAWAGSRKLPVLDYQRGDERWAAFVWRGQPQGEGEFELRGRNSLPDTFRRAALQTIQKRYPDAWPADYVLARAYAAGGYTKDALGLLAKSARGRGDWWAPYYAMGQYYARKRDKENGVPVLRKVVELAPECRQARVSLSLLNNLKDDVDEP